MNNKIIQSNVIIYKLVQILSRLTSISPPPPPSFRGSTCRLIDHASIHFVEIQLFWPGD